MLKKVSFNYKGKRFNIAAENCDYLRKISGLMFIGKEKARALLFDFKEPVDLKIHSFFVFFPFIAVWLSEKNEIIEVKKVKPFTFSVRPKEKFSRLLEIPINQKYGKEISRLGK